MPILSIKTTLGFLLATVLLPANYALAQDRLQEVVDYAEKLQASKPNVCIVVGFVSATQETVTQFGPCQKEDYFQIGSITKVFTATTLVVSDNLNPKTALGELVGGARLSPDAKAITLSSLATHTSGLPRLPDNLDLSSLQDPYASYIKDDLFAYLATYQASSEAKPSFEYSNLGAGLLGQILAAEQDLSYADLVHESVLIPLRLDRTFIDPDHPPGTGKVLQGHDASGEPATNWRFAALAGAGAIWSNIADMLRFTKIQLGLIENPLSEAITITQTKHASAGAGLDVGLGWMIDSRHGETTIWHNGGTAGFRAWMGFTPSRGEGAVVLASGVLPEVDAMGEALMGHPVKLTSLAAGQALSDEAATLYLGRYQVSPQFMLDFTKDGTDVFVQASGQPKLRLINIGDHHFRADGVPAEFKFQIKKNESRQVTLFQGGQKIRAQRKGNVPTREKISIDSATLARYIGTYNLRKNFKLVVTQQDGGLWVQATGQQNFPIFAETETRFFYEVVAADIEFKVKNAIVQGLWLHQNGKHYAKKIID
ncbi:MAG: serine hydrolase [Pseudomonadales bacterium]|nr:serine hydrolase [Pseudomonadales bacterium]